MKDYYKEIDNGLKEYESFKPYQTRSLEWLSNRIDWCWKWKKISENQKNELVDRIIEIFKLN